MLRSVGRITITTALALAFFSGIFLVAIWSVGDAVNFVPTVHADVFDTTGVSAASFVVFDQQTGTIFASKDTDTVHPIASVTKLITASIFYGYPDLDATTTIQWSDVNTEGAAGDLHPQQVYTYRNLLYPLLLSSSNDAATAMLRVHPSLLKDMHAYVASLGLQKTSFVDTSGLSEHNVSTVHELSVIALDLFKTQPHIFDITRLHQFVGIYTGWINNNPMVAEQGYRGGKHGYTEEANRTIVSFFDEKLASGQTRTIGYVLLGSENLQQDMGLLRAQVRTNVSMQ